MKTILARLTCLLALMVQLSAFAKTSPAVSDKLIKAFHEAFPLAEKIDWKEQGDHYLVHFTENALVSVIEYDHDGNFVSSVRYFDKSAPLPLHISWELHHKFSDKTIFGITEISANDETIYFIKMEDAKSWITVKAQEDGTTEVMEKFKKQ